MTGITLKDFLSRRDDVSGQTFLARFEILACELGVEVF